MGEAFMWFQFRAAVIPLMFIGFVVNALAEDQRQGPAEGRRQVLTGKERLGPKWTDEQRIDNCLSRSINAAPSRGPAPATTLPQAD
jgi:hypothetical protein